MKNTTGSRTLIVDVDDTILTTENRDYVNSTPFPEMIQKLNMMHDEGWEVIYFTARGQVSKKGDLRRIELEVRPVLEDWMSRHGVRYSKLLMGKPYGAYYIDDKALRPDEFLKKEF